MSLTPDGAQLAAAAIADRLAGAELVVSDGEQTARAEATVSVTGPTVVLSAVFGELEANFEWSIRRVDLGGVVVDEETVDHGRKALGAVWTLDVEIAATA